MIKKLSLLLLLLTSFVVTSKSLDLKEMSEEEKQLTGLSKLSSDELDALSEWLNNKQTIINRENRRRNAGFEDRKISNSRREFKARLDKQYKDKLGRTYYELDNGQIWKSTFTGSVFLKAGGSQLVTVEPAALGSWKMQGDGNTSIKVMRIK